MSTETERLRGRIALTGTRQEIETLAALLAVVEAAQRVAARDSTPGLRYHDIELLREALAALNADSPESDKRLGVTAHWHPDSPERKWRDSA